MAGSHQELYLLRSPWISPEKQKTAGQAAHPQALFRQIGAQLCPQQRGDDLALASRKTSLWPWVLKIPQQKMRNDLQVKKKYEGYPKS